jgi:hypothetical protein
VTKFFLLLFLSFFLTAKLAAQIVADSGSVKKDTPVLKKRIIAKDSILKTPVSKYDSSVIKKDTVETIKPDSVIGSHRKTLLLPPGSSLFKKALLQNPYFNFYGWIQYQEIELHKIASTDGLFYLILGLCFYFALIRLFFWKYLNNLFSLFFRATMRQQQIREQALQTPLPSLLLNILFLLTFGLYACFLIRYYKFTEQIDFWVLFIYCLFAMIVIYVAKFSILKLCGWVFNITKASDNYIFIVFLVNKILGIALLPFIMIIAFSGWVAVDIAMAISILMVIILFLYRFIACFGVLRSEIKLNVFHYFLYLCAFEIAPLLLIYKVVLSFLKKAY